MGDSTVTIRFLPGGQSIEVPTGTPLRDAASLAGIAMEYPCAGLGNCGKCVVSIQGNGGPLTDSEWALLGHEESEKQYRLACQAFALSSMEVEVADGALLPARYQVLTHSTVQFSAAPDPPLRKCVVSLPPPTLEDDLPDAARLARSAGPFEADPETLDHLGKVLRECNWAGTAVFAGGRLVNFGPANPPVRTCVVAFDIGTTTLAGRLIELPDGSVLAEASSLNPQVAYGADILSRITYGDQSTDSLHRLRQEVIAAINELIDDMTTAAQLDSHLIYAATFAGNTVMQHILAGLDPSNIGVTPFVPITAEAIELSAEALSLQIHPKAVCYIFPVIAGYVGGDTIAGLLASGFAADQSPALFIDIGTNGEMVARNGGKLLATSCAAGPAFEGSGIVCGMRASEAAIEAVRLEGDVHYKTIANRPPRGICGSGLIDLVAELLRTGLLDPTGILLDQNTLPSDTPQALAQRLLMLNGETAFVVAHGSETRHGKPVYVLQSDIRQLQLATAAVRSGVTILLRHAGLHEKDLKSVLVAGAFGNYIRPHNAQRIGLLPSSVNTNRIQFGGNTALAGAHVAALSLRSRQQARALARTVRHVDLSLDPAFQDVFVESLFFPNSDRWA